MAMAKQVLGWRYGRMNNLLTNVKIRDAFARSLVQLTRYALIGIVTNLAGYLLYLFLVHLGTTPKLTMTCLYGIGAVIGFIGNRNLTFAHTGSMFGSGVRYFLAHCVGYGINLFILIIFVDVLGYPHQWVQAMAIFVVAGFLFIAFKFFVFKIT
jgi:putative flippase GtrA